MEQDRKTVTGTGDETPEQKAARIERELKQAMEQSPQGDSSSLWDKLKGTGKMRMSRKEEHVILPKTEEEV